MSLIPGSLEENSNTSKNRGSRVLRLCRSRVLTFLLPGFSETCAKGQSFTKTKATSYAQEQWRQQEKQLTELDDQVGVREIVVVVTGEVVALQDVQPDLQRGQKTIESMESVSR